MKAEQIKEITEKATEQLVAALQQGHSETLTCYLKAIGRFHRYSLHNVLLIALQKPNASHVAGFRTWNQLGRFVKKGEKGIMILAPIVRRKAENSDHDEKESSRIAGFRAAYVFDVSQTDGQELPQIGMVHGDPRECGETLRRFAAAQEFVFYNQKTGEPFVDLDAGLQLACEKAEISGVTWHTLRHTFASRLLERGVDIMTVKELLGRSSVTVTMRYTHSNLASKVLAVGKLGATATIQLHPAPKRSSSNPKCSKLAANL